MITLVVIWQLIVGSPVDALALSNSAPRYLSPSQAWTHLIAARTAGAVYRIDPDLLLSIARHESHFSHTEVTKERGGKVSCGVMTPEPTRDMVLCANTISSVLSGYMAGARHLRGWIRACHGDTRCALLGYAGGYDLLDACSMHFYESCGAPEVFTAEMWRIKRHRKRQRIRSGKQLTVITYIVSPWPPAPAARSRS